MGIDQGAAGVATKPRTLAEKVWDDHVVVSGGVPRSKVGRPT